MDNESGKIREEPEVRETWKNAFVPPKSSVEPTPRWVRVKLGGEFVADSKRALLLIEYGPGKLPTYCFPIPDVRMEMLAKQAGKAGADRNSCFQEGVTVFQDGGIGGKYEGRRLKGEILVPDAGLSSFRLQLSNFPPCPPANSFTIANPSRRGAEKSWRSSRWHTRPTGG